MKTCKLICLLLSFSLCFFSSSASLRAVVNSSSQTTPSPKYAPDRIIVKFKEGKDPQRDVASLNTKHKVKQIKKLFTHSQDPKAIDNKFKERAKRKPKNAVVPKLDQIYILEVEPNTDIQSMVSEYKNNPNVEYAELDYEARVQVFPQTLPNDTYVDPDQNGTWSTGAWTHDPQGDCLEALFKHKRGYFRQTKNDQVMEKVDEDGNLLGFSVLKVSRLKKKPLAVALS